MEQKQPTRIALLAVGAIFIVTVQGAGAADGCIEKPNAPSPQGSHWYYRTDRTNNRQCWYLSSERGKAGTLPHQDTAAARPQSSKMSEPPAQTPAQATAAVETATAEVMPAEAAPFEITAGQGNTPGDNSTVTLSKFRGGIPTPPNSSSVSVSAAAPQEMGLTGPIVTPTKRSGTVRGLASSFLTQFCALLAAVLGLAAIIGTFTLSAGREPMPKSQSARGQLSAARTDERVLEPFARTAASTDEHVLERFARTVAGTDEHVLERFARTAAGTDECVLEPFAHTAASTGANVLEPFAHTTTSIDEHVLEPFAHTAASTDERVLEPFARTAASTDANVFAPFAHTAANSDEAGMAADWASSPPTDTVAGIESTLQHLLRGLEQLRHEEACRGFEPTRKAVA
jgi:hypothetical protein